MVLAVMVKPYGLILVPWLIARGRMRSVVAVVAGMAVAFLLPAMIYGLAGSVALHLDWWRTVSATTAGVLTHPDNVSVAAMYMKWFGATATVYTLGCRDGCGTARPRSGSLP